MSEFESPQPPPDPSEDAIIRDIMAAKGISYDEARYEWDMEKAKLNLQKLEKQRKEEDEDE